MNASLARLLLFATLAAFGCATPRMDFDDETRGPARALAANEVIVETDSVKTLAANAWEASIAISPANPNLVLATAMRWAGNGYSCEIHRSEDGGRTWLPQAVRLPLEGVRHTYTDHGDPVIAFDRTGTAYCSVLMRGPTPSKPDRSSLAIMKSTDDGRTWQPFPITERDAVDGRLPIFDDKEWIAVDNSGGPYDGTVYVAWTKTNGYSDATTWDLSFSRSRDGGLTWSEPSTIGSKLAVAYLQVGPDGTIYFSHSGGIGYQMQSSADGGDTWTPPHDIARMGLPQHPATNLTYNPFNILQAFAVDASNSSSRGNLYFVYPGSSATAAKTPASVYFTRSTNGGVTWSEALRLSAPPELGREALLPEVTSNPVTGEVVVAWLDRRDDPKNTLARLYVSQSTDGGATFDAPRPVTNAFSIDARFLGHYNVAAAHASTTLLTVSDAAGNFSIVRLPTEPAPRRRAARP